MKLRKIAALVLVSVMLIALTAPVAATGYAGGPWNRPNYPWMPGGLVTNGPDNYGTGSSGGTTAGSGSGYTPSTTTTTTGGGATTTITDPQTPLTSGVDAPLTNNNGATPVTAERIIRDSNGNIIVRNASTVNTSLFSGMTGVVHFDTVVNGVVLVRIYVDAAKLAALNTTINVDWSIAAADVNYTVNKFSKHFSGNFASVSLGQKGSFPISTRIAVHKLVWQGISQEDLQVLAYGKVPNTYTKAQIESFDNSYVYFNTVKAGELVFTNSKQL